MKFSFIDKYFFRNGPSFKYVKTISIIIVLLFISTACDRVNLWENNYTIPEVTVTSASATATSITFAWTDPPITEMKTIYITCTHSSTSSIVHTGSVTEGVETYTITGVTSSQKYNINIRVTDKYGKSSPGANFTITALAGGPSLRFIYTVADLNAVRGSVLPEYAGWGLADTYNLMADLDLNVAPYNTDPGWDPITIFTGVFEGNGHTIRNLYIYRSTNNIGLFGNVTGATFNNLNLVNISVTGGQTVGGLVGNITGGTISGCRVSGTVTGTLSSVGGVIGYIVSGVTISGCNMSGTVIGSANNVGGLIGYINTGGTVTGCSASGKVAGISYIGGLVGFIANGSVSSSYTQVEVVGGGSGIGGLIGNNAGPIDNCHAICTITSTGTTCSNIGGLTGYNTANISGSYARGTVTVTGSNVSSVGGLIGNAVYVTSIINSNVEVNVTVTGTVTGNYTGGLIGRHTNNTASQITIIDNCHATGKVTSSGNYTGGLIGYNNTNTGTITVQNNCYATGSVTGTSYTGGLVGQNENTSGTNTIDNCHHMTGNITGNQNTGGLVGNSINTLFNNCSSSGIVTGNGLYTGGLIGQNTDTPGSNDVGYCSSSCNVNGYSNFTGGLIGWNDRARIKQSHATGNVTVTIGAMSSDIYTGGLIGYYTDSTSTGAMGIDNSSFTGTVEVTLTSNVTASLAAITGGLIGYADPVLGLSISKSNSIGIVRTTTNGTQPTLIYTGGLIGLINIPSISLCKSNCQVYAIPSSATCTYAAGLIGRPDNGSIISSFSNGSVTANTSSNQGTGGLVGFNNNCSINNSYSLCNVEAAGTNTGGFVGYNNGATIQYCYSAGTVGGTSLFIGGFGGVDPGSTITDCYYDFDVANQPLNGIANDVSPSDDMKVQLTFSGWDFPPPTGATWLINTVYNNGYPYLCYNPLF